MTIRSKLILAALALATLVPTGSILTSTDAAAFHRGRGPFLDSWTQRWRDRVPLRSGAAYAIRSGRNIYRIR